MIDVSDPYPAGPMQRTSGPPEATDVRESGGHPDVSDVSVGEIVAKVTADLSTLMRQELELAKAEIKVEVRNGGKTAGLLGGAGGAGYFALLFLSLTVMFALDEVMPLPVAALIVTVLYGIAAALLFLRGKQEMKQFSPAPTQTVESLKEDVQWAKTRGR